MVMRGEQIELTSKYEKVVKSDPRSPRYYKACDVARIARNCVADTGIPAEVLMACVAKELEIQKVWVDDKDKALNKDRPKFKDLSFTDLFSSQTTNYTAYLATIAIPAEWSLPEEVAVILRGLIKRIATGAGMFAGVVGATLLLFLLLLMEFYKSIEWSIAISASDVLDNNTEWCDCKRKGDKRPQVQRDVKRIR